MRTKLFFLTLGIICMTFSAMAQREQTVLGKRSLGFSGIWGGSKHQFTRFGSTNTFMNAWHFGLEFGKALTIGWGRYDMNGGITWTDDQNMQFRMNDINWHVMSLGYSFNSFKAVHPVVNIDAGKGFVHYDNEVRDRIWVIQPSAGVEINVLRWFHLVLEGGYRFVTDSDINLTDRQLSNPYAQATLKFGFSWGRYRKHKDHERRRDRDRDRG